MNNMEKQILQMQQATQMAFVIWLVLFAFAFAIAIWIFRDAESRGKNGIAASVMVLAAGFVNFAFAICVVCAWILLRPQKHRQGDGDTRSLNLKIKNEDLAEDPSEFLGDLEL